MRQDFDGNSLNIHCVFPVNSSAHGNIVFSSCSYSSLESLKLALRQESGRGVTRSRDAVVLGPIPVISG